MLEQRLYFDCAATTPLDKRVSLKMRQFFDERGCFGNASSSTHLYGVEAASAVELARRQVATALNCRPRELIWVSGATEANNLAIFGTVGALLRRARRRSAKLPIILTVPSEHKSVLEPMRFLGKEKCKLVLLRVGRSGMVDLEDFEEKLRVFRPIFASLSWVNNETGVVQDVNGLSALCQAYSTRLHVDAAQAFGKVQVDLQETQVDIASFSAHKSSGPKGVGALFIRGEGDPRSFLSPLFLGGSQERGLRPGTLPVHQVAGMGEAFEIVEKYREQDVARVAKLSGQVLDAIRDLRGIVHGEQRVPHILNVYFRDVNASRLVSLLSNVALSRGSACLSDETEPSHVLKAMRCSREQAENSVRLSLGRMTKPNMISALIHCLKHAVPSSRM